MTEEKKLSVISTIQRALGIIEGITYGLESGVAGGLTDAIMMIDEAMEGVFADEKV